jgi:cysteine desulfuration protein SufE
MTDPAMTDTIAERGREVAAEFAFLDDWTDRYALLIEQARALAPYPDEHRDDAHRVRGCQSQVWLHTTAGGGRVRFAADSDALITKGLIALLVRVLDGQPAAAVARADLGFLDDIGLKEHLSPTRANGLAAMVARMRAEAAALAG